jgi:hypothetical protein
MGRAFRVLKRTAHLTVQVSERSAPVVAVGATGSAKGRKAGARKSTGGDRPAKAKKA